jgi:hypothetical protein
VATPSLTAFEDYGSPLAKFPLTKSNKLLTKNICKITVEELNNPSPGDLHEVDQVESALLRQQD